MDTLKASTRALASGTAAHDSTYNSITTKITDLTNQRNTLAGQIKSALDAYTFGSQPLDVQHAQAWITQATGLLAQATDLAA